MSETVKNAIAQEIYKRMDGDIEIGPFIDFLDSELASFANDAKTIKRSFKQMFDGDEFFMKSTSHAATWYIGLWAYHVAADSIRYTVGTM